MQTVRYNLKMNGWENQLLIMTTIQPIVSDVINVTISITGIVDKVPATLNVKSRILTPSNPITIRPYKDDGKDKVFTQMIVPKHQVLQITDYISF